MGQAKLYPDGTQRLQIRLKPPLMAKLKFVAKYNARSMNRHIEYLIQRDIDEFEREHGAIDMDEAEAL